MATVKVGRKHVALVDDADLALVCGYKWQVHKKGTNVYARAERGTRDHGTRYVFMHRVVLGLPSGRGLIPDHFNGNGLDNRRDNLRVAVGFEINNRNRRKIAGTSSRFKGVTREHDYWKAYIYLDSQRKHLGIFRDELQAARAYDDAATQHFGEHARLNGI